MSVIDIRLVESGQSKAIIGIAGRSGDGKTYTALHIARGMVDKASEIGFLDTENKRGSLYAHILDDRFMIGDLYPPFSPKRYSEAIKQFQDSGIKVLVIDSITHEYEGTGGLDDIANAPKANGEARKTADWNTAKREHRAFMNVLLHSNINIICCIRARDKVKIEIVNGRQEFVDQGVQPICEKNFMFEMTASIMMLDEGRSQKHIKVPSFLREAFGEGVGYLGYGTGRSIRKWLEQGETEDSDITRIKSEALLSCEKGFLALNELWKTLSKEQKGNVKLINHFKTCTESAKAYDRQNINEDLDKLVQLQELFSLTKDKLEEKDIVIIQSIIDNIDVASYDKVINNLGKMLLPRQSKY